MVNVKIYTRPKSTTATATAAARPGFANAAATVQAGPCTLDTSLTAGTTVGTIRTGDIIAAGTTLADIIRRMLARGTQTDASDTYARRTEGTEQDILALWTLMKGLKMGKGAGISSADFVEILSSVYSREGDGFSLAKDEDGRWRFDITDLNVRGRWTTETVENHIARYMGGRVWMTVGGSVTVASVDGTTVTYKPTDRQGRAVTLLIEPGDWVISESIDVASPRKLTAQVTATDTEAHTITLSRALALQEDDELIQLGSTADDQRRQYAICLDSSVPAISIYRGLTSPDLPSSPYIRLSPDKDGSTIRAKFINEANGQNIGDQLTKFAADLGVIKTQTDRQFVIWFGEGETERLKVSDQWNTDDLRDQHAQDIFYDTSAAATGSRAWRWRKADDTGAYEWHEITDADTIAALERADKAQTTANGKTRTFVMAENEHPQPPYDPGDQWAQATYQDGDTQYRGDLLVCRTAKTADGAFALADWQPAQTMTTAKIENLGDQITISVTDKVNADMSEALTKNYATMYWTKTRIESIVGSQFMDSTGLVSTAYRSSVLQTTTGWYAFSKVAKIVDGQLQVNESGVVTEANFAEIFAKQTDADGNIVTKANIGTYIEEGIAKAKITADQVTISGDTTINQYLYVDSAGNVTLGSADTSKTLRVYGDITATTGRIGGFEIDGGMLTNARTEDGTTTYDTTAAILFQDKEHAITAAIGTTAVPTSTGNPVPARIENLNAANAGGTNTALILKAAGAARNYAIAAQGDILTQGLCAGCKANFVEMTAGTVTIVKMQQGDKVAVHCKDGAKGWGVGLPTRSSVQEAFQTSGTFIADISFTGYSLATEGAVYGRNATVSSMSGADYAQLHDQDGSEIENIQLCQGDTVTVRLVYDGAEYSAWIVSRMN